MSPLLRSAVIVSAGAITNARPQWRLVPRGGALPAPPAAV